jgi:AcrR family transcriptional regulator
MLPAEVISMGSQRPARRIPTQERSRRLVHAVREAGALILTEEGPDALTTTRIAERAGVSVGSLYQYFENREAVLHAIYEEKAAHDVEAARRWIAGLSDLSPRDRAAASIRWAFDQHRRGLRLDPEYYRKHHWDFSVTPRLASGESEDSSATALARQLLNDGADELRGIDVEHAAALLACGIPALIRGVLDGRPELIEDDSFCESVVDLVCGWLYGDERADSEPAENENDG